MSQSTLSPLKELVSPSEMENIVHYMCYPKPHWMLNHSTDDQLWIFSRVGFTAPKISNHKTNVDKMSFNILIAPGEYLLDDLWGPLLRDLRNSLLYLHVAGKITRPLRIRDVFRSAVSLIFHTNELRKMTAKRPVRSLEHIKFDDLKSYLLSFNVERSVFETTLEYILNNCEKKEDINWDLLKTNTKLTTRSFMSLKHKLTQHLNSNSEKYMSPRYFREYPQANICKFDLDYDLAPSEKTISNAISQLEALNFARPAQQSKFQHSPMKLFSSGRTIFKLMTESTKTPLMPVNVALHSLSSALYFVRVYGQPLRQYLSDLNSAELRRIKDLGYAESTCENHKREIQNYAFENTPPPECLTPLNITSWTQDNAKLDASYWKDGMSMSVAVKLYVAAMWIILASFTAGRATSLHSLKRDCFKQSPVDGLFDLVLRIPKNSEKIELEETHRPIPDLIFDYGLEFASLVCELEDRRGFSTNDSESYLFGAILSERSISAYRYTQHDFYKAPLGYCTIISSVELFQDWSGSPVINGKRWYPSTHQFRRLFAVLYFNFTDQLGLEELSWFMGHANMDQTFHYAEVSPTDEWLEEAELTIAKIGARLKSTIYGDDIVQNIVHKARQSRNVVTVLEDLVIDMIHEHKAKTGEEVRFRRIDGKNVFFYFTNRNEQ